MATKPILFSTPMVQALLDGRKTQTRRVMRRARGSFVYCENNRVIKSYELNDLIANPTIAHDFCPYGKPGELLWVRESFTKDLDGYVYKANCPWWDSLHGKFKKPSIHMPRRASRITLEITDVRVEKLQDISEEDAEAEGVEYFKTGCSYGGDITYHFKDYLCEGVHTENDGERIIYNNTFPDDASSSFKSLWKSINGKDSWDVNPWIWVVEFKVHKCNVDKLETNNAK